MGEMEGLPQNAVRELAELDVLERLRKKLRISVPVSQRQSDSSPIAHCCFCGVVWGDDPSVDHSVDCAVADAIAEIERKNAWQEVAMQEIHDLAAKLRAITEAEPVRLSFPEDDIALIRGVPNSDDYWDNHDFCRIADMMEKYDLVPKADTEE